MGFSTICGSVMSIFSDPVYEYGDVVVSYIAKHTCANSVIPPMYGLPL